MNILRNLARELVERRLWPVAALLVVAMVAVPVLLLKPAAPPVGATPPGAASGGAPATVVSAAPSATLKNSDRRLVGKSKDLFAVPGGPPSAAARADGGAAVAGAPTTGVAQTSPQPSGGAGSGVTTSKRIPLRSSAGTSAPAADVRPRAYYVVDVRFGPSGRTTRRSDIPRLTPLPSSGRPAVMFFGVFNGGSSAGFLVSRSASVLATNCGQRVRDCGIMRLRAGRRAIVGLPGADGVLRRYELRVLRIRRVLTRDTAELARARSRVSRAGLCMIGSDANAFGSVFYDPSSGSYRSTAPGRDACKGVSAARARAASAFGPARALDTR